MFLNQKAIKQYMHDNNKQISKEALESLNKRVESFLISAINLTGRFKRVSETEVNLAKG